MLTLLLVLLAGPTSAEAERLQAEDEIRAAAVERALAGDANAATPTFTLTAEADPEMKGLRRALERRGLKPSKDGHANLHLGRVAWTAGDLATVEIRTGGGGDWGGATYVVVLRDGRWTVSGVRNGWITEGPRPPRSSRTADAPAAGRRAAPGTRGDRGSRAG